MKLLDDKIVSNHFKHNILNNIITNDGFDKNKIRELEKKKILILHNRGKEATIYKIKIEDVYYVFKLYYHNFNKKEDTINFDNEKYVLSITKKCIQDNICPNYIYCYKIPKEKYKYQYTLLEYADGTLYEFLNNFKCTEDNKTLYENIIKSMLFQVLVGLLVLHEKYSISHNDLHLKNIFYNKIEPETILNYKINDTTYKIETFGYLFMLGDFGHSTSYAILKEKKSEYIKYNKLDKYKKIKASLIPLVSENYDSFKTLHNRIIMEYLEPYIEDNKNMDILIEKKLVKKNNYDDAYKYLISQDISKKKFNKRMIQYLIDNNNIDMSVLLPKYMISSYEMFKNIIPYVFTYTNYLQISYVLQMFFKSNIVENKFIKTNTFIIQTPTIELSANYRTNIDITKRMLNLEKYIEEFKKGMSELNDKSLINFAINNKSNVISEFSCKYGVIGIDYFNKYGLAGILELSYDKKYKEVNEKIIKIKDTLNNLIDKDICPHFFKTYIIDSSYVIVEPYTSSVRRLLRYVEYKTFFDKIIEESMELKMSIIFQYIVTNLCLFKYCDIDITKLHIQLYWFKYIEINQKSVFKYVINGVNYYVPTYGYLLVMHSEKLLEIKNAEKTEKYDILDKKVSKYIDKYNCMYALQSFYMGTIKIKLQRFNIKKSNDLVKIIEQYGNSVVKEKFNEFKIIIKELLEEAYNTYILTSSPKEEYMEYMLYIRYVNFIYKNDINILKKYINANELSQIVSAGTFMSEIMNENIKNEKDIVMIFEKYFKYFRTKLNSTHTFTL